MGLLRFLLATSVVIVHSSPIFGIRLVGGQVAVQTFFIISGFYMALIINEKYSLGGQLSYRLFIQNRLLRIFPSYLVVLFGAVITYLLIYLIYGRAISSLAYWMEYASHMRFTTFAVLVLSNVTTMGMDLIPPFSIDKETGLFALSGDGSAATQFFIIIRPSWTLGVELTFYLLAPFIVKRNDWILIAITVAALAFRILGPSDPRWAFPGYAVFFFAGCLAYRLYRFFSSKGGWMEHKYYPSVAFFGITAATFLYQFVDFPMQESLYYLLATISIPFVFACTKRNKLDRYVGELSYPIYISHWFLKTLLVRMLPTETPHQGHQGIILFSATLVMSALLYVLIDRPVDRFRQHRLEKEMRSRKPHSPQPFSKKPLDG